MATRNANAIIEEFDDAPTIEEFDDAAAPAAAIEEIDEEIVAQEAQRASAGAVQALDVMAAPRAFDWSEVNEKMDAERLYDARSAEAQALVAEDRGSGTGPGSDAFKWRRESERLRESTSPFTAAGKTVIANEEGKLSAIENAPEPQGRTPSQALSGFLGPGLAPTVMPVVEGAVRNAGAAAGGALAAAKMVPGPVAVASRLSTALGIALPIGGSIMGAIAGGSAQEALMQIGETPEETQRRQQLAAEDAARNPGLTKFGGAAASGLFFGPSLAQFGRAARGDVGAATNIALSGTIGAGAEVGAALLRGDTMNARDIAEAFFLNSVLNEPTKLGRKLGLKPSSEQQAVEDAAAVAPTPAPGRTAIADVIPPAPDSVRIADTFPVRETQPIPIGETLTPAPEPPATRSDEQRIAELVAAGMTPEEAAAGIARAKAAEVPPVVETPITETPVAETLVVETPAGTSIKNAVTAEERAARGIDPVEEPARREFGEVWDAVKAEVAETPAAPDALLAALRKKPRALTDREDALILYRQIELQKAYDVAAAEVNRATEAGDEPLRAEAMSRLNDTRDALQDVYDIGKQAGTETARGLNARKMMANQEFNLIAMETRLRADNGGRLSEEQAAQVKAQADTIAKTQAEMDRILAERDALKAELEATKKEDAATDPKVKSLADRIIARLDISAANAAKSLRSRLNNLGSAPDPLIVLDVARIAAAKTAKGAVQFAQWSADMVKEFGEKVRPFLKAGWDQREQHIDGEIGNTVKTRKTRTDAEKQEAAVKARLTALANRTAKLKERTGKGDFSPMRKPPLDLSKNPEWVKAKAANDAAKAAYEKARYEARKAQRTIEQKIKDTVADVWSASRPILASTDISAPGRQGIFFSLPDLFMNPMRLGRQLRSMFRSQFSESKFQENEAAIKSRDNADLYEESDLYLADIDHKPSAREEQFKSELAEKIPGIGRIVRGSSRGFSSFMNTVRADAMDAFVKWSGGKEKVSPETAKYLAAAINDLSGRGNVTSRQAQGALEWLAKYLFSPRLWVSRYNTARLKPIWKDPLNPNISLRARAVVLGQYVRFLGAVAAVRFLASMWGIKMELDPRSSDFGKLRVGSKTYDITGGIGNMVTFLARVFTGKTKDDKGKTLRIVWDDEKRPERELMQVVGNHMRNKMAPIPGAVYDLRYGRHPDRSKVTSTSMLKQTTVPITVSDTVEFFQKDNPAAALRDTAINALGVSVNDYRK